MARKKSTECASVAPGKRKGTHATSTEGGATSSTSWTLNAGPAHTDGGRDMANTTAGVLGSKNHTNSHSWSTAGEDPNNIGFFPTQAYPAGQHRASPTSVASSSKGTAQMGHKLPSASIPRRQYRHILPQAQPSSASAPSLEPRTLPDTGLSPLSQYIPAPGKLRAQHTESWQELQGPRSGDQGRPFPRGANSPSATGHTAKQQSATSHQLFSPLSAVNPAPAPTLSYHSPSAYGTPAWGCSGYGPTGYASSGRPRFPYHPPVSNSSHRNTPRSQGSEYHAPVVAPATLGPTYQHTVGIHDQVPSSAGIGLGASNFAHPFVDDSHSLFTASRYDVADPVLVNPNSKAPFNNLSANGVANSSSDLDWFGQWAEINNTTAYDPPVGDSQPRAGYRDKLPIQQDPPGTYEPPTGLGIWEPLPAFPNILVLSAGSSASAVAPNINEQPPSVSSVTSTKRGLELETEDPAQPVKRPRLLSPRRVKDGIAYRLREPGAKGYRPGKGNKQLKITKGKQGPQQWAFSTTRITRYEDNDWNMPHWATTNLPAHQHPIISRAGAPANACWIELDDVEMTIMEVLVWASLATVQFGVTQRLVCNGWLPSDASGVINDAWGLGDDEGVRKNTIQAQKKKSDKAYHGMSWTDVEKAHPGRKRDPVTDFTPRHWLESGAMFGPQDRWGLEDPRLIDIAQHIARDKWPSGPDAGVVTNAIAHAVDTNNTEVTLSGLKDYAAEHGLDNVAPLPADADMRALERFLARPKRLGFANSATGI